MSAKQPSTQLPRLRGNCYARVDLTRRLKCDEVRKGPWGGRTAKGAILKICMPLRMVVMFVLGKRSTGISRTELQQKRGTARRHESHGDIGTKDERGQQCDGQYIRSSGVTVPGLHAEGASMPESASMFQPACRSGYLGSSQARAQRAC